ncbi:MAG TPA: hypothetical protein VFS77_06045 [Pyrinomonadaceae bacterium]|nr:hypothetical protein [Pyrinomonadaceae bacterium]
MDDVLLPFIQESDEANGDLYLTRLIDEHAAPIIRVILGSSAIASSQHDADDLFNDIVVNLIARLRQIKLNPEQAGIADFRSYVAGAAYNACNLHLRQKFPRRSRLKNRLRYLTSHHDDFALWTTDEAGLLCGLAHWRDQTTYASTGVLEKIRQDTNEWLTSVGLTSAGSSRSELSTLLKAIFHWCALPIKLDDLVTVVADVCREKDLPDEPIETVLNVAAPVPTYDKTVELQRNLKVLWREICQLPTRQRVALLLNFRDSRGQELISLLPYTRAATIEQIAEALEFPLLEFLNLWKDLPLEDLAIAQRLGATRQQVINLRKCARERLERRMSAENG